MISSAGKLSNPSISMSLNSDSIKPSISGVFEAKRVAVVGASSKPGNLARRIVSNLLTLGFDGEVFPVGRSGKELLGLPVFRSVPDLPVAVDLAVIAVPALQVPSVLEECGQKGVRYATITSSGFGEYTEERSTLDGQLLEIAGKYGMRFLGPNCQGVRDYATGLCTRFGKQTREDALLNRVGLIVQSGTVSSTIERFLKAEGIGLTRLASIGNKLDVDEVDLLPVLLEHEPTRMICMYLEGIRRGREFIEIAEQAEKPIVLLKGNIAPAAARIARSHSASILNEQRVMEAAARQAGIIQVTQLAEFPIVAKSFMLPPMRGNRLVIFSGSGGMGVVGADWAHRCGFDMPSLEDTKARAIEKRLPGSYIKIDNPVDIGDFFDMQAALDMVDELLGDATVDGMVVCIFDPTPGAVGFINVPVRPFAVEIEELVKRHDKPVALVYAAERKVVEQAQLESRFPVFLTADEAIRGLAAARDHWRMRRREREPILTRKVSPTANPILDRSLAAAESGLDYLEAFQVLEAAGIPVEMPHVALTAEAAVQIARSFAAPVVLKAILEGVSHKTEADGVRLGVSGDDEVVAAFNDLRRRHAGASIVIQRMVSGLELMVGSRRDPHFGPTVSVGPGGIFVELFDDLAVRLAPVTQLEAQEMLQETRAGRLLQGFRGKPPADAEALVETLQSLSRLVAGYPALSEIDINPLIVLPKGQGVRAVDVRIFLTQER
jgi:acetate---CoA ligase (ADP-forming)